MRHIVRYCLRGFIICLFGLVIAACSDLSGLSDMPDIADTGASNPAARGEIAGVNEIRMRVAKKAMETKDYGTAVRFYETVHDAVPGNIEPLLGMGEAQLAWGKLEDAESTFRTALRLSPDEPKANEGLGRVLVSEGAFLEAIQHFKLAMAKAPSASLHNKLGVANDLMGDGDAAQRHYRAAIKMDPNYVSARNNLALSLAISGEYPEAISQMEQVVARPDATQRQRQNLAFIYGMAGRLDDTERVLGRQNSPKSERERNQALFDRIRALAKTGDRPAILALLRSAKPGSSFDQMDKALPPAPAPKENMAALTPASPKDRGLRKDEMAVPTPETAVKPMNATGSNAAKAPTPAARATEQGSKPSSMARLSPAGEPPEDAAAKVDHAAPPPASAASGSRYRVQLGSYRSERTAVRGRKILLRQFGKQIPGLEVLVRQPRRSDPKAIDYRLRTAPLPDHEIAMRLCTEMIAAGDPDCLVILHNDARWQTVDVAMAQSELADAQYRLQLASYRTEKRAIRGRRVLSKLLGDRAKGLEIMVKQGHTDDSKAFDFTIRTAPVDSREEGARLCDTIHAAGYPGCLVVRHNEATWHALAAAEPPDSIASQDAKAEYRLQLASYRTEKSAIRGRAVLTKLLGDRAAGLEIMVKQGHTDGSTSFDYIIRTAPVDSREEGARLCDTIRAAGYPGCLVVRHNDAVWHTVAAAEPQSDVTASEANAQYRLQLASYRSEKRARRGRAILSKQLAGQVSGLEVMVRQGHADGSQAFDFTIRSAPLDSRAEGARLCDAIRTAGYPRCLVVRHNDAVWQVDGKAPAKRAAAEPQEPAQPAPPDMAAQHESEETAAPAPELPPPDSPL